MGRREEGGKEGVMLLIFNWLRNTHVNKCTRACINTDVGKLVGGILGTKAQIKTRDSIVLVGCAFSCELSHSFESTVPEQANGSSIIFSFRLDKGLLRPDMVDYRTSGMKENLMTNTC